MASKFNSEFNYRYQVVGETPWEKIKTLHGFLEGRKATRTLQEVGRLKDQAKLSKLKHLQNGGGGLEYEILELKAEILEGESLRETTEEAFKLNTIEIETLENLLKELYVIAEPTRIPGYTDEEMYEANALNEFTIDIGKELQAEMIANGRPSPGKLRIAMRNPVTWNALKKVGIVPEDSKILTGNINPQLEIELKGVEDEIIQSK